MDSKEEVKSLVEDIKATKERVLEEQVKRLPQLSLVEIQNRFTFHPAGTEEKQETHEEVRARCKRLAIELNNLVPEGREKALAITKLEEVMMWANAGIARQNDGQMD